MKRFLCAVVGVLCFTAAHATIRTLSNTTYSPGQYTTFAAAHTAAVAGDTIYVHGSPVNYGPVSISKANLVIIGAGHNPAKTVPLTSMFTNITVGATGCQFIGLTINVMLTNGATTGTVVRRCKLQATQSTSGIIANSGSLDGWLIEGNVFLGGIFPGVEFAGLSSTNTIVRNNIFNTILSSNSSATIAFSFQIVNNLFLGTNNAFTGINQAIINNNIFYRSSPQGASAANCTMSYNISYLCALNTFSAPGLNNLVGVNPMFTSFPAPGALFDYSHDYRLAAGSPGLLTGDDGTDRGVFGGFGGRFNMTGEPAIAEITSFSITSPTIIAPGGTLTISVTSKRIN